MRSFEDIKSGLEKMFPGIWNFFKGLLMLVLWESFLQLKQGFVKAWKESGRLSSRSATVLAGMLVTSFIVYGIHGLWSDTNSWRTKEWRESLLTKNYKGEVATFFEEYGKRFAAHDCDFMREVGADEAMYDKWGKERYGNEYKCEEFVHYQDKVFFPLEIGNIENAGDKYHVRGKVLVVMSNQGESLKVDAMYFDLWKTLDWDWWHFNNPKEGPRKIDMTVGSAG